MSVSKFTFALSWLATLAIVSWVGVSAAQEKAVQEKGADTARMATYTGAADQTYYALSLLPTVAAGPAADCDLVVVCDTSASQVGQFREDTLGTLAAMLGGLSPRDRVKLLAADLEATALTASLVPAAGSEVSSALQKLRAARLWVRPI